MNLTKNFKLTEFLRNRHGFVVTPNDYDIKNLTRICKHILQPLRDEFNTPIIISSGLRSIGLNAIVGGTLNSQHLSGNAVDFQCLYPAMLTKMWVWLITRLPFDQVIYYNRDNSKKSFIHVSLINKGNRRHAMISEYGCYVSLETYFNQCFNI